VHPSNLVLGETCLYCFEKKVHQGTLGLDTFESFSKIYHYLPVVSILISLTVFLVVPVSSQPLIISIILLIMMGLSLISSFPHISPTMFAQFKESQETYKNSLQTYNPHTAEFCVNHPQLIAIARCPLCFKPLCTLDFTYGKMGKPLQCQACIKKYMNFRLFPTIYYLLTVIPLGIVGFVSETLAGSTGLSLIFLFIPFIIFFWPLGLFMAKRVSLSQTSPPSGNFY